MTTISEHHLALTTLVSRYFRSIDERRTDVDSILAVFTADARAVTPVGTAEGHAAIAETSAGALAKFAGTQHISSDVLTDIDVAEGRAAVSWNSLMTHVHLESTLERLGEGADPLLVVGGRCRAKARLTDDGWRFAHLSIEPMWLTGQPPFFPEDAEQELAVQDGPSGS